MHTLKNVNAFNHQPNGRNKALAIRLLLLLPLAFLGGCSSTIDEMGESLANFKVEPWVKPYERSNLADPIMAVGRNPIAISYAKHVHESREGARGADGAAGGGCGCN